MDGALAGTAPKGASVTSGTISATAQITAGDITINTVAMPVVPAAASAAARTQQLVDLINSYKRVTGANAELVTATTFKINSGVSLVIALGGTATLAACGLTAGTTAVSAVLLATRKAHGSSKSGSDEEIVKAGGAEINVGHAKRMGLLSRIGTTDIEISAAATPTRVNS